MAQGVPSINIHTTLIVDLRRTALAGTAALIWETLITFGDEVRYIWPKPNNAWIKYAYLFLRYFPLAVHICNRIVSELVFQEIDLGYSALRGWYAVQVLMAHLAMSGVELVMMARVYALYNNSRLIGRGFACLWLIETAVVIIGLVVTLPGLHFEQEFFVTKAPHSFAYLAISTLVSQAVIFALTFAKYLQGEWEGTSLIHLLVRDGTLVYIIFFVSTLTAAIYSLHSFAFGMAEYSWLLTIISTVGCRLILNMQRLPSRSNDPSSSSHRTSSMELTTLYMGRSSVYNV
ncbi:hypothetical protein MIND_00074600 [Mycena indigotica]|uniref:DUF6533 domain-containing protein n=1 Tax=Mycena indigotica TaxID=2126181 RepID=A0A8H6TF30_9AGAR|nr:uncharacterized protein MIND_00074600 [Mycena indigotica]KAF7315592.1 hypothetical protein MIND_00074600 [Mycena indigotica]